MRTHCTLSPAIIYVSVPTGSRCCCRKTPISAGLGFLPEARKVGEPAPQQPPRLTAGRGSERPPAPGQQGQVAACARRPGQCRPTGCRVLGRAGAPGAAGLCCSNPGERAHPLTRGEPPGGPVQHHAGGRVHSHCRGLHGSVFKVGYDVPELPLELPSLGAGSERAPSPAAPSSAEPSAPPAPAPQPWTWTPGPPPFSARRHPDTGGP